MGYFLKMYLKYRDAFGLSIFIIGTPFIYFLRDGIGLAPGSTIFGTVLLIFPLASILFFNRIKYFEAPNRPGVFLLFWFVLISFIYFLLTERNGSFFNIREFFNFFLIFLVFFTSFLIRKNSLNNVFIVIIILFSIIGAFSLLYLTLTNPEYQFGQRASFSVEKGKIDEGGNPHINSRAAFYGIVASVLFLKYNKDRIIFTLLAVLNIFLCFGVLFFTQTFLAILATACFLFAFTYKNLSFKGVLRGIKNLFSKWYVLVILCFAFFKLYKKIQKNSDIFSPIAMYFKLRFGNLIQTLFTFENSEKAKSVGDVSANTRLDMLKNVGERLQYNLAGGNFENIIIGNGYAKVYVDVPYVEVFDSLGLLMFIFYTILYFYMVKISFKEINNPYSIGTEFIAYCLFYYFIANFTAGVIIDYTRIAMYIFLVRFINK